MATMKPKILGPVMMCPLDMTYLYEYIHCHCDDKEGYIFFDDEVYKEYIFYGDDGHEEEDHIFNGDDGHEENYDDSCNVDDYIYALQLMQAVELEILEPILRGLLRCGYIQQCCNCCVSFMEGLGYLIVGVIFLSVTFLIWIFFQQFHLKIPYYVPTFFIPLITAWFVFDVLWSLKCFRQQNRRERWVHRTPDQEKFELSLRVVKKDADIVPSDKGWCWFTIQGLMVYWPWFIMSDEKDWNLVPKSENRAKENCPSSVSVEEEEEEEDVPTEGENSSGGIVYRAVEMISGTVELD